MMDDYITSRASTGGMSFTHVASITSTAYQAYTIENMDQYTALEFYVVYTSPQVIVANMIMPLEVVKNATSSKWIQPTYYDGSAHYGQIYFNTTNSIFGKIISAASIEVYGIK